MLDPTNPFKIISSPRGYDALFQQLVDAVPPGDFYDFSRPLVPWVTRPIIFILQTDNPGVAVKVSVLRLGDYAQGVDQANVVPEIFFVPSNEQSSFSVSLGRGKNRIIATEQVPNGRTTIFEVIASENTLILEPFGKEIFRSVNIINNQQQAIFSKYSTRLLDQVINFQDLLSDVQSLKILATKLLVRSQVHFPAKELGIQNFIESFMLNTPVMKSQRESSVFKIERSSIKRLTQNQSGSEAHVWVPNLAVTRWLAFTRMANSLKQNYQIVSVRDDLVEVLYKGDDQLHSFNYDAEGSNFLTNLSLTNCFDNISMQMSFQTILGMNICMWSYPFDEYVTDLTPIGRERTVFDVGIPFDMGLPLDSDPIDPFSDGWVGWSLTGRFDYDSIPHPLDSEIEPAATYAGPACSYLNGPYTQMLNSNRADMEINYLVTASGTMDDYTPGPVVGLDLDIFGGTLTAGTPVLAAAKFTDSNHMVGSPDGSGIVTVQESNGGASTPVPVSSNGFQDFFLTPTKAGPAITWALSSGALFGVSAPKTVLPAPFAAFVLSAVGPQSVGVPFAISIQAVDMYGNNVTDVGNNMKVTISEPGGGFPAGSLTPLHVDLVNGAATALVTITQVGTGTLEFSLAPAVQDTNVFTVS